MESGRWPTGCAAGVDLSLNLFRLAVFWVPLDLGGLSPIWEMEVAYWLIK